MMQEIFSARIRYDASTVLFHWSRAAIIMRQFISTNIWGLFHNPLHHTACGQPPDGGNGAAPAPPHRVADRVGAADVRLARSVEYSLYGLTMMEIGLGHRPRVGGVFS